MKKKNCKRCIPVVPFIGQKVYLDSHYYISHGSDDIDGGVAVICAIQKIPKNSIPNNRYYVKLKGFPNTEYPYSTFMDAEEQERLRKEFGKQKAKPNPDIDTPWIEEGDIVGGTINGKKYNNEVYKGPPVW